MGRVITISGYFDPIHVGHIDYIKLAKEQGDTLVVILNNDQQSKLKKGKVFMSMEERRIILENIKGVDMVFPSIDTDLSVCKSLEWIRPDAFANGGDRHNDEIPEAKICEELDIEIIDGLGDKIQSSSELIKKLEENDKEKEDERV